MTNLLNRFWLYLAVLTFALSAYLLCAVPIIGNPTRQAPVAGCTAHECYWDGDSWQVLK